MPRLQKHYVTHTTTYLSMNRKDVLNKKCYCVFNDVTIKKTLTTQTVPVMIHKWTL